jgi:lactate permease
MFNQRLAPVGGSLVLSVLVAALPIVTVLVALGVLRRPAWQASLAGLVVALVIATGVWEFPIGLALDSVAAGSVFALWPVMWIVINGLLLYNIAVVSGRFEAFREWVVRHLPDDRRIVIVVIGFCFGSLLEGIAGFGTPVAITSALLILIGLPPLEALTLTLIFGTAPVKLRSRVSKSFIGPGCTMRCSSPCTTNPMPRTGPSSRSARERPFYSRIS